MSEFLRILENEVQIAALLFMATVYTARLIWIFRFNASKEYTYSAGNWRSGVAYSILNIAMPWAMESTRKSMFFYAQFVIFHLGVIAAIAATFIIPYWPELFEINSIMRVFQIVVGTAFVVGIIRLIRRIINPVLRLISTPDDYFSLILLILWFAAGIFAIPNKYKTSELPLIIFFFLTVFFLVYVPFSKICHYLYYPFTRYYLGKTMGHRDVFPRKKGGEKSADLDN
jgi:nitrate reductase gamma subunit